MARCAMFSAAWSGPTAVGEDCKTHGRSIQIAGRTLIEPRAWALAQPRFLRACACDGVSAPSLHSGHPETPNNFWRPCTREHSDGCSKPHHVWICIRLRTSFVVCTRRLRSVSRAKAWPRGEKACRGRGLQTVPVGRDRRRVEGSIEAARL